LNPSKHASRIEASAQKPAASRAMRLQGAASHPMRTRLTTPSRPATIVLFAFVAGAACATGKVETAPSDENPTLEGGAPDASLASRDANAAKDAASDSGGDSGSQLPECDVTKAFGSPVPVENVSSAAGDWGARLSPDELTMYLGSSRQEFRGPRGSNIYFATRRTRNGTFSLPELLPNVNTDADEVYASATADGLRVFVDSNAPSIPGKRDIFLATREKLDDAFGTIAPVPIINSTSADADVFVTPSGNAIYFVSNRPGSEGYDIYRSGLDGNGKFDNPELVKNVNSSGGESLPLVTADELTLFFASDRSATGAKGGWDVWVSRRATVHDEFGAPELVDELNTDKGDVPTWLSPDGCTLYLSSDRNGTLGDRDIWVARRPR
jgi:hypothetical protein